MNKLILIVVSIFLSVFLSVFLYGVYNNLNVMIYNDQKKIESLEASIVEKDRLLLIAEVKDLLLKDIKNKNMDCVSIMSRCNELTDIKYVKMLQYRYDSLENHIKHYWH
jgi:hypothetical protein